MDGVPIRHGVGPRDSNNEASSAEDASQDNAVFFVRQSTAPDTRRSVSTSSQHPPSRVLQHARQEAAILERNASRAAMQPNRPKRTSPLMAATRARLPVPSMFDGIDDAPCSTAVQQSSRAVFDMVRDRDIEYESAVDYRGDESSMNPPPSKRRRLNDELCMLGIDSDNISVENSEPEQRDPACGGSSSGDEDGEDRVADDVEPFVKKHAPDQCYLCLATTTRYPKECRAHLDSMAATILAYTRNRYHVDDTAALLFAYQETTLRPEFRKVMPASSFSLLVPRLSREAIVEHIHTVVNAAGGPELWMCINMPNLKELYSIMVSRTTYIRRLLNDMHVQGHVPPPNLQIDTHEVGNIIKLGNYILSLEAKLAGDKFQLMREESGLVDTIPRDTLDNNAIARHFYATNSSAPIKSTPRQRRAQNPQGQ